MSAASEQAKGGGTGNCISGDLGCTAGRRDLQSAWCLRRARRCDLWGICLGGTRSARPAASATIAVATSFVLSNGSTGSRERTHTVGCDGSARGCCGTTTTSGAVATPAWTAQARTQLNTAPTELPTFLRQRALLARPSDCVFSNPEWRGRPASYRSRFRLRGANTCPAGFQREESQTCGPESR